MIGIAILLLAVAMAASGVMVSESLRVAVEARNVATIALNRGN